MIGGLLPPGEFMLPRRDSQTQSRYVVIWQASTVTLQRHARASSVFRPMNATLAMLVASARSGAASGGLPSSRRSGPASHQGGSEA